MHCLVECTRSKHARREEIMVWLLLDRNVAKTEPDAHAQSRVTAGEIR